MAESYEGWAILELLGHRRLAGYVRQAEQFGVAMLRLDIPEHPWVDGCTCGSAEPGSLDHEKHQYHCQAFRAPGEDEPRDVHSTQFYGGSSIYALTPVTEEVARAVATRARPTPVHAWEMPRPALPASTDDIDELFDDHEDEIDHADLSDDVLERDEEGARPF